jgi:hypothetical protein
MENITFRNAPTSSPTALATSVPQEMPEGNDIGPSVEQEPVNLNSMPQTILDVLGIEDDVRDLPSEESNRLSEIASYLEDQLKASGKMPNALTIGKKLDEIREELEMDEDTEKEVVLDRLGGVVKAWRDLGFLKDPASKRSMFMKLARCPDSKSMHKLIFSEMNRSEVWR